MPIKRKTTRKKVYKRKPRRNNLVMRDMVSFGAGFPKKVMMKHKYSESLNVISNLGAIATHKMVLNGLFDPNNSGIGHQPMYFDQMSAIYNHYTVIGAKITCHMTPYDTNASPVNVCLWQNDDSVVTPATMDSIEEQTKSYPKVLGMTSSGQKNLTLKWSAKKTFGSSVLANSKLSGDSVANPAENSFAMLSIQATDFTSTVQVAVRFDVEYLAIWYELKDIAGS